MATIKRKQTNTIPIVDYDYTQYYCSTGPGTTANGFGGPYIIHETVTINLSNGPVVFQKHMDTGEVLVGAGSGWNYEEYDQVYVPEFAAGGTYNLKYTYYVQSANCDPYGGWGMHEVTGYFILDCFSVNITAENYVNGSYQPSPPPHYTQGQWKFTATAVGGDEPYTYSWGSNILYGDNYPVGENTETVTVTDNTGCEVEESYTFTIEEGEQPSSSDDGGGGGGGGGSSDDGGGGGGGSSDDGGGGGSSDDNGGSSDGSDDGSSDGSDDGSSDGSDDGSSDGSDDGSSDGSDDGSSDGSDDGSSDESSDSSDDSNDSDSSDDSQDSNEPSDSSDPCIPCILSSQIPQVSIPSSTLPNEPVNITSPALPVEGDYWRLEVLKENSITWEILKNNVGSSQLLIAVILPCGRGQLRWVLICAPVGD